MTNDKDAPPFSSTSNAPSNASVVPPSPEIIEAGVTVVATAEEEVCNDSNHAEVQMEAKDPLLSSSVAVDPNEDPQEQPQQQPQPQPQQQQKEEEDRKPFSTFQNKFQKEDIDVEYKDDLGGQHKEESLFQKDNNDNRDHDDDDDDDDDGVSMNSTSDHSWNDEHISIADTEEVHTEDVGHHNYHKEEEEEYPKESTEFDSNHQLGDFCDQDLSQSDDSEFENCQDIDNDDNGDTEYNHDHDLVSENNSHQKDDESIHNEYNNEYTYNNPSHDKDDPKDNHDDDFPTETNSFHEEEHETFDQDATQNGTPSAPLRHLIINMDSISLTKNDHETWFHHHLVNGFDHVCKEWKLPSSAVLDTSTSSTTTLDQPIHHHHHNLQQQQHQQQLLQEPNILINIIDPTTPPPGSVSSTPEHSPSRHMKRRAWNRDKINHNTTPKPKLRELNIFEKLDAALDRQCGKTLRSVRYRNLRTGEMESIDSLPIRMELRARMMTDAVEWHNGPICHVYIAACCSVEHYREKVRPSLRAFVSQMEGVGSGNVREGIYGGGSGNSGGGIAGGGNSSSSKDPQKAMAMAAANRAVAAAKDVTGGSSGAKYMIVFVPIHPSTVDGEGSKTGAVSQVDEAYKGGGIGLRGRIAAAAAARRNNHGNSDVRSMTNMGGGYEDTVMSLAEDGMTVSTSLSSSSASATTSAAMLSKEHREIHKKFLADFPNGKICVLSTLLDSDHNLVPENPVQKQELHTFCQDLGKTVLMGFVDRIQRYNEELKRCEIEPGKGGGSPSRRKKLEAIDWKHYFLIKESAAITYEQMRLPMEALHQYDEIEAKFPMNAFLEGERKFCPDAVRSIATTGCTESFRGIVKSTKNIADIQHLVSMYILGRQVQLLFLQKLPRAAINKCLAYVKNIYKLRCEQAIDMDVTESQNVRLQNEIWAASACWDLKMASEAISSRLIELMKKKKSNEIHSPPASPERRAKAQRVSGINEKALLRSLCDVLNYARNRLLKICEVIFPPDALIRRAMEECPSEAFEEWQPLEFFNEMDLENVAIENVLPLISPDSWQNDCYNQYLLKSLESDKAFEELYIDISHHLIQMYELLERNRTMSRMLAELAEIHILRGDLDAAAEKLLTSIENFSLDPWDTLLAWRVFRLACCQRKQQQSKAPEYLKSLTCCLGSRLAKVIPEKFHHLLTLDLKTLVGRDNVSEYRWDLSPLFETSVSLKDTSGGMTTFLFNESSVELHSCRVGDDVEVEVALNSSLAEQIEVDELKITMLRLEDYETVMDSNADVTKSQGAIVISSGDAITINPGNNTFPFSWSTISADKFVVGSVYLQWRKAAFHQDFITSSNVMVGLEVLPAEYTQSTKIDPDYVIPGHVQDINIHFHSGSDFVTGGKVQISCSKGLQVMNPKTSEDPVLKEWHDSCEFSLGPCLPNSDITLTASVKSEPLQPRDPNIPHQSSDETESTLTRPSLKVEVITSYHHGSQTEFFTESKPIESPAFTTILETTLAALEYDILSIKTLGFYPLNPEMFIISATVRCQIPIRFNLTDWNISLPSSVILDTDGDLNVGICNQSVTKDDEICFGFRCKRSKASSIASQSNNQVILAITLSDDIGRSFQHEMPIDIAGLDEYLSLEDTSSDELITDINLSLSSLEGLIGSPITFNYDIDCNSLQQKMSSSSQSSSSSPGTRRILYQLSTSGTDWIVGGGNVKGTLSTSSDSITTRLSFIAVPTRVGIIANYPTLHLSVLSDEESGKTLAVRQKDPTAFVSMNQMNVKAMAFVL